ncbi:Aste57867_15477 [Aphanomyces stellatus]|uniref:Aste57867_15477 protein n=1 Tax=Aphanomyces stellatus TaxID=120398 RepID=A0A485L379_9STRA|nr:hypothetical protein As57867_015421 [Aphanomyces stellatus]VFT92279.1 Aste57867_15477 [Aphanomyces stellatus]
MCFDWLDFKMSSNAIELVPLAHLESGTVVSFLAYVHQIHQDKLKDKKHMSIWIGDRSVPFFKLHAWSDECTIVRRRLQARDICCFQDISVRSFRGNKEAHVTRTSTLTVVVRKNQFQNTTAGDGVYVPFTRILPLVEWSKALDAKGFGLGQGNVPTVKIKDLRENMLAHVVCRLRPLLRHDTFHHHQHPSDEHMTAGSVRQFVMVDGPDDGMVLNLWHDHLDPTPGALVRVRHVVIAFNSMRHSLMGHTTGDSSIEPISSSPAIHPAAAALSLVPVAFDSFADAAAAQLNGGLVLRRVSIEQLVLAMPPSAVWHSALLTECYCTWCECTLPEQPTDVVPRLYGACVNQCQASRSARRWRYRPATLHVRDRLGQRMALHVQDAAMQAIVAHIPAAMVADCGARRQDVAAVDARDVVRLLLESFVSHDVVNIQVYCHCLGTSASRVGGTRVKMDGATIDTLHRSDNDDDDDDRRDVVYSFISLED